jgi:8-oxo-dGTP diphosphatase
MQANEKRPLVGVGVIVEREGKVLLGKRKGSHGAGYWSFAGGHLEFGETVEQCAARELLEETDLQALSFKIGPWTNDIFENNKHYITLFVFVPEFRGEPKLMEKEKCEGWEWFDWNQLPTPLFAPVSSLLAKLRD